MSSRRREASRRHIICGRLSLTNTIARLFNIGVTHQQGAFVIDDGVKPADEGVDPGKMAHIPVYNHPEIPRYLHIVRQYSFKQSEESRVGKSVSVSVDLGGRRINKKKK